MDAASVAQFWSALPEEINEESIIVIAKASAPRPGRSQSGYTITAITPDTPPGTSQLNISQFPPFLEETYLLSHLPPYLCLPPEDIHIILSAKSGAEQATVTFENVLKKVLKSVGLDETRYQVLRTESSDSVKEFAGGRLKERANAGAEQTVVLLSGDGGVVDVINGLMEEDGTKSSKHVRPTIALFPLGTGNALFHSLHRPLLPASTTSSAPIDLTLALRTLLFGTSHSLPIFRTTFSPQSHLLSNHGRTALPLPAANTLYGAIVASYGLHATLVADSDTPEWRQHGAARFSLVAKELLSPSDGSAPHAYKAKLILRPEAGPERVLEREEHGYMLLTLVSNLEKTFTISPASEPLDGRLRIVHFGPETGEEVGRIMGLAYQGGRHVERSETRSRVAYEEVRSARIEFLERDRDAGGSGGEADGVEDEGRWRRVCIDGLIVRVEEGGWMEVEQVPEAQRAIDIVVRQGDFKKGINSPIHS